ncbi:hypothetical protein BSK47_20190 [Paenibacillus odorifer]|uniref:Uncharacterized protein n=1 Tax=Paenibacillus odorifer TaxID=189426 RepID=A0AB36JEC5_9BACL|nr:hypothetical protein BSK47_20190 [Paenibacillus odorifer]
MILPVFLSVAGSMDVNSKSTYTVNLKKGLCSKRWFRFLSEFRFTSVNLSIEIKTFIRVEYKKISPAFYKGKAH